MARILWLNWSGGGNLPPSLGIARVLTERGHQVAFAGRPEMVPRVKTAGFRAIEITQAYAQVDRYPQGLPLTRPACYLTSPGVEEEVRSIVAAEAPDLILIDAMFPAALAHAGEFGRPSAVLVHTFVFRQLDMWRKVIGNFDNMRQRAGFPGLPPLDALWQPRERIISTSLAAFDAVPLAGWEMVRHAGPVLEDEKIRRAAATAVAERRSDPAGHGQLQHHVRAAQCRQDAARARCARRLSGSCRCDYRRNRGAKRACRAEQRRRARLCGARPDHETRRTRRH